MENMMYKIEGEDLYLIGTSEHSMIGKFIDTILDEDASQALTSYSRASAKRWVPMDRGTRRLPHTPVRSEMIVVCKPEAARMVQEAI